MHGTRDVTRSTTRPPPRRIIRVSRVPGRDMQMLDVHDDETARLAALREYRILDTEPERAFDDLALLASQICETPIALITIVDAERQWFKAHAGLSETETPRAVSFCAHAIQQRGLFIIHDAREDARFQDNPFVTGGPFVRFYAGAPLLTPEGHALGTLCVIDSVPRTLTPRQRDALDALRRQVQAQLELRRNLHELRRALAARDLAEADVIKLAGLVPYCSTCQLDLTVPADPSAIPRISDGVSAVLNGKGVVRHRHHGRRTRAAGGDRERDSTRLPQRSLEAHPVLRHRGRGR